MNYPPTKTGVMHLFGELYNEVIKQLWIKKIYISSDS